jgi:hypothetical protein
VDEPQRFDWGAFCLDRAEQPMPGVDLRNRKLDCLDRQVTGLTTKQAAHGRGVFVWHAKPAE